MDKGKDGAANRVFSSILKEVKPTAAEIKDTTANINKLMRVLKSIVPGDVELLVAGSIARGTNLSGHSDIDIFMLFNKDLGRDEIVKLGIEYGKRVTQKERGRYEIKYAEHPYIRLYLDSVGIKADLVPALKIDNIEEMGTTVDRTPLHNEFINSHLNDRQRDDVRVLKYFLRCHGVYGAEVKTNGFSGYLCELLIHHYGSLSNLLKDAQKFKLPLVLEPKIKKDSNDEATAKRFNSQFVVIDPVDKDRNVAAGVSTESLSRFVLSANLFLKDPGMASFGKLQDSSTDSAGLNRFAESTDLDIFILMVKVPDKSEDVLYPQLRKINLQIEKQIQHEGFATYLTTQLVHGGNGFLITVAPKQEMGMRMLKGPSAFIPAASEQFMKKHKGALGFTVNGTDLYALEKAKYRKIGEVLKDLPGTISEHKDIDLRGAKLLLNTAPKEYSDLIYLNLKKKLSI